MDNDASVLGKHARYDDDNGNGNGATLPVVDDDDDDIGPMPVAPDAEVARKKRKGMYQTSCSLNFSNNFVNTVLPHERLYLDHLPNADRYSKSFMHRDVINFVVSTKSVNALTFIIVILTYS